MRQSQVAEFFNAQFRTPSRTTAYRSAGLIPPGRYLCKVHRVKSRKQDCRKLTDPRTSASALCGTYSTWCSIQMNRKRIVSLGLTRSSPARGSRQVLLRIHPPCHSREGGNPAGSPCSRADNRVEMFRLRARMRSTEAAPIRRHTHSESRCRSLQSWQAYTARAMIASCRRNTTMIRRLSEHRHHGDRQAIPKHSHPYRRDR